jgi:hypothetical protein
MLVYNSYNQHHMPDRLLHDVDAAQQAMMREMFLKARA